MANDKPLLFKTRFFSFAGLLLGLILTTAKLLPAQSIDTWEPVNSGVSIPTSAAQSHRTSSAWIGYSDGQIYFTSWVDNPYWTRMDKNVNMGVPFDMEFVHLVTAIATADSYDDYIAYIGFSSEKDYSSLWRCMYNRGGIHWEELAPKTFKGLLGVSTHPLDYRRLYVATSNGVRYSSDYGASWTTSNPNDPLTPPSGSNISAVGSSPEIRDHILVGCDNGEIWKVSGARAGNPSWTQLAPGPTGNLPKAMVTRLQADQRDAGNRNFLAVFGGKRDQSMWISRNGGRSWFPLPNPIISSAMAHPSVLSGSFSPCPTGQTLYGQTLGYEAIRSDNGGLAWFRTPRWSGKNLSVEYQHYDRDPYPNQLMPLFRVANLGSVPVSVAGMSFQYLFTPDGKGPQTYFCDWSPYGCTNVQATIDSSDTRSVLTIKLLAATPAVPAGQFSGEIQGRVAKSDWTPYNQANDYSFLKNAFTWTTNRKIRLYSATDGWLWGMFPQRSLASVPFFSPQAPWRLLHRPAEAELEPVRRVCTCCAPQPFLLR